jgi:hypothetical protein
MEISARYAMARNTSNLKIEGRTTHSAADIIGAAGMARQSDNSALLMLAAATSDKTSAKLALADMLEKKLADQMMRERWRGSPRKIAHEVVAWHLHGTCQPCGGRGEQSIPGTPSLTGQPCNQCQGTGKVRISADGPYKWAQDYISRLISQASGQIHRKLS